MRVVKAALSLGVALLLAIAVARPVAARELKEEQNGRDLTQLWGDQPVTEEQITLSHKPYPNQFGYPFPVPVKYTISYGSNCLTAEGLLGQEFRKRCQRLPILFLLNGANVRAKDYSKYIRLMAQRGYTIVASDYWQTLPPGVSFTAPGAAPPPADQCPAGKALFPSAALIKTFLDYAPTSTISSLKDVQQRGIVLVGHSFGAVAALTAYTNGCASFPFSPYFNLCEGYQPSVQALDPSADGQCPQTSPTTSGLVLGAIVYEGWLATSGGPANASAPPPSILGATVPASSFLLYLSGQYGASNAAQAYSQSKVGSCACLGLVTFEGVNHFGVADHQYDSSVGQITPCARKASYDPDGFECPADFLDTQQKRMAAITDNFIRARVFNEWLAQQSLKLRQALTESFGDELDYTIKLNGKCY